MNNTDQVTHYVLEDGTTIDPSEVSDQGEGLVTADGRRVARRSPDVYSTRSVDPAGQKTVGDPDKLNPDGTLKAPKGRQTAPAGYSNREMRAEAPGAKTPGDGDGDGGDGEDDGNGDETGAAAKARAEKDDADRKAADKAKAAEPTAKAK